MSVPGHLQETQETQKTLARELSRSGHRAAAVWRGDDVGVNCLVVSLGEVADGEGTTRDWSTLNYAGRRTAATSLWD